MNCLFVLVLLGCCRGNRRWNWGNTGKGDCAERRYREKACDCTERHDREESCGCAERRDREDNCRCTERYNRENSCSCAREEHGYQKQERKEQPCDCESRQVSGSMRYDEGMRNYARMDTVPEMREGRACPMYPEDCSCSGK